MIRIPPKRYGPATSREFRLATTEGLATYLLGKTTSKLPHVRSAGRFEEKLAGVRLFGQLRSELLISDTVGFSWLAIEASPHEKDW